MAKPRSRKVMLKDFFADREEGKYIDFDDDEYMVVVPIGSLPKTLVDEAEALGEDADDNEAKKVRVKQQSFLIKEWLVKGPDGSPYKHPSDDPNVFDSMDRNLDTALHNVVMSAFTTREDKLQSAGEE